MGDYFDDGAMNYTTDRRAFSISSSEGLRCGELRARLAAERDDEAEDEEYAGTRRQAGRMGDTADIADGQTGGGSFAKRCISSTPQTQTQQPTGATAYFEAIRLNARNIFVGS